MQKVSDLFCGHAHKGGYIEDIRGIHHVTMQSPLEAIGDEVAYGTLDMYANHFVLRGEGRVPCRYLKFTAMFFVVGTLFVFLKAALDSDSSPHAHLAQPLQKIVLNHLQLVSLASSFPLKWPKVITGMFEAKKRLQKEQAQWMVGKRKIKMKIKKAPKTVQGDIDAYKNKHEMKLRNRERKQREKDYRESQVPYHPRKFLLACIRFVLRLLRQFLHDDGRNNLDGHCPTKVHHV